MKKLTIVLCILSLVGALFCGAKASDSAPALTLPVKLEVCNKACNISPGFSGSVELSAFRNATAPAPALRDYRITQDPQPEPRTIGFAGYYSFCSKVPVAIVMARAGGVNNFLGLKINPDLSGFTGPGIDGIVRAGGSITVTWKPQGSNLGIIGGFGVDWPLQDFEFRKVGGGLVLGIRYETALRF